MRIIYVLLILVAFCSVRADATIRYVKPTASGSGNGSSWANASSDLQAMINASSAGDEVWVAAGTYLPTRDALGNGTPTDPRDKTFLLKGGVDVYGGFAGNETSIAARNIAANRSILSGDIGTANTIADNSYHVVLLLIPASMPSCILDGFLIKDGWANGGSNVIVNTNIYIPRNYGGGIYTYGGTGSILRNLHIANNHAAYGGGIYIAGGGCIIKHDSIYNNSGSMGGGIHAGGNPFVIDSNIIFANDAYYRGGGALIAGDTSSVFSNNVVFNNTSSSYGGGLSLMFKGKVLNNTIYGNTASVKGGAMFLDGTVHQIVGNAIFNNSSQDLGGAVFINGVDVNFINNTFLNNFAKNQGGAVWALGSNANFRNNIFWKNRRNGNYSYTFVEDDIRPSTVLHSNVFQNNLFQLPSTSYGYFNSGDTGNIFLLNPSFVNDTLPLGPDGIARTADDGVALTACSPAINTGLTPTPLIPIDILGNSRTGIYDMGAYEFQGTHLNVTPVEPIGGYSSVCTGTTTPFTNTVSGGVWSSADTTIATVSPSGVVSGKSLGTTTIFYIHGNTGCRNSIAEKTITVETAPSLEPITGSSAVCQGGQFPLYNSTPKLRWSSSNYSIALVGNYTNYGNVVGLSPGYVTIYASLGVGCSTTVSKTIQVLPLPTVAPITGKNKTCAGDTIHLHNETPGGVWNTFQTSSTITPGGILTAAGSNAEIRYTVADSFGCKTTVNHIVNIYKYPVLATIQGPDSICELQKSVYTNTVYGGTWSSGDTNIAKISLTGEVTGVNDGVTTIYYTATSGGICSSMVSKEIRVRPKPVAGLVTGDTTLCLNNTMQLSDTIPGGAWSMASKGQVSIINLSGEVKPMNPGTDTAVYIVTNTFGCTDTSTFPIEVLEIPIVDSIRGADSVCLYQKTTFIDSTTGGFWHTTDTSVVIIDSNGLITTIDSGLATIHYSVVNAVGCTTTVSKNIFIKAVTLPAPIAGVSPICVNHSEQYQNLVPGGVWSTTSGGSVCDVVSTGLLLANNPGTDTVLYTITNNSGCSSAESLVIVVNAPLEIPIAGPDSLCAGEIATLNHNIPFGKWANVNTTAGHINSTGIYTSSIAGTDTLSYQYVSNGCPIQVKKNLLINTLPEIPIISGDTLACKNGAYQLNSSISGGVWSRDRGLATVSNSGMIHAIDTGQLEVRYTVINEHGCFTSSTHQMSVNEVVIDAGIDATTLVATSNHADAGYKWINCDTYDPVQDGDNARLVALTNGRYAAITTYKGCADTSECIQISILGNGYPIISPNPASGDVSINTGTDIADFIKVLDALGRVIVEVIPDKTITIINVAGFSKGIYPLHINFGGRQIVRKLIVK